MYFLIIYGTITILALAIYFYVLKPNTKLLTESQVLRDVFHTQMTTEISNTAISINEENTELKIDRLKLFQDLELSKFLIGYSEFKGQQIYFFLEKWLSTYSLKTKVKLKLRVNNQFLQTKFGYEDCKRILKCVNLFSIAELNMIQLRIFYENDQVNLKVTFGANHGDQVSFKNIRDNLVQELPNFKIVEEFDLNEIKIMLPYPHREQV